MPRRSGRLAIGAAVFVTSAVVAATLTASAPAFQDYTALVSYCGDCYVTPGHAAVTGGFNWRTEDGGCRKDGAGIDNMFYANTNDQIVWQTNYVRTACSEYDGIKYITNNGYYRSGCANGGVETHLMYCYTWNYSP